MIVRLGVALKLIEAAPILNDHRQAEGVAEAAKIGIGIKLLEHRPHGAEHRTPGYDLRGVVDANADQKHDEVAVDFRRHALRNDGSGHRSLLSLTNRQYDCSCDAMTVGAVHSLVTLACRIAVRPPRTSLRQRSIAAGTCAGSVTFSP